MTSRYLFVGGLHRSGTSLLAQILAKHPDIAAIEDAPVPENEGVYLQGAIPHTALMGVPGRFAFDEEQHLTEDSSFNTLSTRDYLSAQWEPWFREGPGWRLEKSPVNLLRARLYQQLFPTSQFIFVSRHPVAVTEATAKWCADGRASLLEHWEQAHATLLADLPYLHCWLIVRYEDLVSDPTTCLERIYSFLQLPFVEPNETVASNLNDAYFDSWAFPSQMHPSDMKTARAFGYDIDPPATSARPIPGGRHYFHSISEKIA